MSEQIRPNYYRAKVKAFVDGERREVELECFDLIDAMTEDPYLFNVWKYLFRLGKKDGATQFEDITKIKTYLDQFQKRRLKPSSSQSTQQGKGTRSRTPE